MKTLRKYHKWPSLIIGFFLLLFAISGIIMNHRNWFSGINFPRGLMPPEYRYKNWNLAAIKGNLELDNGRVLVYGNIGIYSTDSSYKTYSDFNQGLGRGMDNRKVFSLYKSNAGQLYAGTLFGLYRYNQAAEKWEQISLPEKSPRVVKISENKTEVLVLTRSHLYKIVNETSGNEKISEINIPSASNSDGKVGLFRTLWIIHSGELLGLPGKILVDLVGLVLIFIVLSGYFYTFLPSITKRAGEKLKSRLKKINRTSIQWHNKIGYYGIIIFIITTLTGMFLRPPLLIPIAYTRVNPIPGTILMHHNPWHDRLRDMESDSSGNIIISTSEGFYRFAPEKDSLSTPLPVQPEVSVMGITAFQFLDNKNLLVGSFSGLYSWNIEEQSVTNYITGLPAQKTGRGNPFGSLAISGIINKNGLPVALTEYQAGWIPLKNSGVKSEMPASLAKLPISLWNLSLEVHTGRIFSVILGDLYILYVPLMGLTTLLILITGWWLWYKMLKRRKNHKKKNANENKQIA